MAPSTRSFTLYSWILLLCQEARQAALRACRTAAVMALVGCWHGDQESDSEDPAASWPWHVTVATEPVWHAAAWEPPCGSLCLRFPKGLYMTYSGRDGGC